MAKIGFFPIVSIILSIALLFLFTVAPQENVKISSQWNLLLLGSIGSGALFLFAQKRTIFKDYFEAPTLKIALNEFAVGMLFGIVTLFFVSFAVKTIISLDNLTGSFLVTDIGTLSTAGIFFTALVQPFTESILMVMLMLTLFVLFRERLKIIPFPLATAIIITFILFSSLHFTSQHQRALELGQTFFPFSFEGFFEFLTDTENFGKVDAAGNPLYKGGLVFLPMGLFWALIAALYRSFWVMAGAHTLYNTLIIAFIVPSTSPALGLAKVLIVVFILIILAAFVFGNAGKVLRDVKHKAIISITGR